MLSACMLDGFGWFPEATYRRTFLLFDSIEYVFPPLRRGVIVPPHLYARTDIRVTQPESETEAVVRRVASAGRYATDPRFLQVAAMAPETDLAAALRMIAADRELAGAGPPLSAPGPWALAYLSEKLLDHCDAHDLVPVVGQAYAARILALLAQERLGVLGGGSVLTPTQASALHTVAAGLSYAFVTDEQLVAVDMSLLTGFKQQNLGLLERHHQHLVSVAGEFAECVADHRLFTERLARLRQDAHAVRTGLDAEAKAAMQSARVAFLDKVLPVAATALATAIGLIGAHSSLEIAQAVTPALGTGIAAAAAATLGSLRSGKGGKPPTTLSYLFEAEKELAALDGFDPGTR